jgi:hypothetical protein
VSSGVRKSTEGEHKLKSSVEGRTYPQEGPMGYEAYKAYFFSSTTIIGVVHPAPLDKLPQNIEEAMSGRSTEQAIGGCNYMCVCCGRLTAVNSLPS